MNKYFSTFPTFLLELSVLVVFIIYFPAKIQGQNNGNPPQQVEFYTHKIFDLKADFEAEYINGYELVVADWNGDGNRDAAIGLTERSSLGSPKHYLVIATGDGNDFTIAQKIEVGFEISRLEIADVNNDGNTDIIAIGSNDTGVYLFENRGSYFISEKILDLDSQPFRTHPFDLSNDGYPEIFIEYENEEFISVFHNDTTGSFEEAPNLELFSRVEGMSLADIDQDGYTDLIVSNNGFTLFVNNGLGEFNYMRKVEVTTSDRYMATGNFNGDEYSDIVFNNGSGQLEVLMNKRDLTFTEPEVYLQKYRYALRGEIKVSDLDNNGYDDIILHSDATDYVPENILVLFNVEGEFVTESFRTAQTESKNPLAIVDMDGDGLEDLLFLDQYVGLGVYYNRGAGEFVSAPYYSITSSRDAYEAGGITTADFNGDDHLDIATTSKNEDNVVVFENNGAGQFFHRESFEGGFRPDQITYGDYNDDGHNDIAVINDYDNHYDENNRNDRFSIFLNDGSGEFPELDYFLTEYYDQLYSIKSANFSDDYPGEELLVRAKLNELSNSSWQSLRMFSKDNYLQDLSIPNDVINDEAIADLNNDGNPDIVYIYNDRSSSKGSLVGVVYNESGKSFSEPEIYEEIYYPDRLTAADLDNNGYTDIIVYNREGIWLMMNDGNAGRADFRSPKLVVERSDEYRASSDLEVGDFDGDGFKDILLMLHGEGRVAFYLNLGAGQFAAPMYWGVGDRPKAINIGDYNSDGRLDLAILNDETSLDFSILINESSVPFEEEEPLDISENVTANADITFGESTTPKDYRLVALPGAVNEQISNLVDGTHDVKWQAFWDDGTEKDYLIKYDGSETFVFEPGNGFWLTHQDSFIYSDTLSMVELDDQNQAKISLHEGWNIISNPLDIDVSWDQVASANGDSLQPIWRFDGSFSEATEFGSAKSGEAFYFLNDGGLEELIIPYIPASNKEKSADDQHTLQLVTTVDGNKTSSSSLKFLTEDQAKKPDVVAPPSGFEGASLRFTNSDEEKSKRRNSFARIYRQHQTDGQKYRMKLTASSSQPVTIKAEGMKNYRLQELMILDPQTGKTFDLQSSQGATFIPEQETTELLLVIGNSQYVDQQQNVFLPKHISIDPNYPNPFNPTTTLQFALPEQSEVRVQIYDVLGRRVSTLIDEVREAGIHTVTFDASRQASGMYFAIFEIGQQRYIQKMMLIK